MRLTVVFASFLAVVAAVPLPLGDLPLEDVVDDFGGEVAPVLSTVSDKVPRGGSKGGNDLLGGLLEVIWVAPWEVCGKDLLNSILS
jgi:hypothetical protein